MKKRQRHFNNRTIPHLLLLLASLLVCLLACCTPGVLAVVSHNNDKQSHYVGPGTGCSPFWSTNNYDYNNTILPSTWCHHQNVFASRLRFLSDIPLPIDSAKNRSLIVCSSDSDSRSDSSSSCTSIVAMRPISIGEKDTGYLLAAFVTGEMVLLQTRTNIYSDDKILLIKDSFNNTDERRIMFDMSSLKFVCDVSETSEEFYVSITHLRSNRTKTHVHSLSKGEVSKVVDLKILDGGVAALLIYTTKLAADANSARILFFQLDEELITLNHTWTISPSEDLTVSPIRMNHFIHHGNFSTTGGMQSGKNLGVPGVATRNILVLNDHMQVRMFEHVSKNLHIDLRDTTSSDSKTSTFFEAPTSSIITAVNAFSDPLRRPYDPENYSTLTCDAPQLQVSRSVYLLIGLYFETSHQSILVDHLVPEFSSLAFSIVPNPFDPGHRGATFGCGPGQYKAKSGECAHALQHQIQLDGRAKAIQASFVDVPSTLGGVDSYTTQNNESTILEAHILCQNLYEFAPESQFSKPTAPAYVWKEICKNTTIGMSCEVDMINGKVKNIIGLLDAFFYQYWKAQIAVLSEDDKVTIFSHTVRFEEEQFGDFDLTTSTQMEVSGTVTDFYLSPNGMHLLAAVSRKRWELDSMLRYSEICTLLQKEPDNIFLSAFRDPCLLNPPRLISYHNFAVIGSSCSDHVYCPLFIQSEIGELPAGMFLLRNFLLLKCPKGSYCINGVRINCPPGFVCDEEGLQAPHRCPASSVGTRTCYGQNLVAPTVVPKGNWANTMTFPPIPVPPGKYLLKIGNETLGMKDCSQGDYCPLAREITIQKLPGNYSTELLCPQNTFCPNVSTIQPGICRFTSGLIDYCPSGTVLGALCPAGYYCPSMTTKKECKRSQYCPEGSIIYKVCEPGYYCPTPSTRIICPKGSYCPAGSVHPKHCLFRSCPEGTKKNSLVLAGVGAIAMLLLFIGACYAVYALYNQIYVNRSSQLRTEMKERRKGQSSEPFFFNINAVEEDEFSTIDHVGDESLALSDSSFTVELKRKDFYLDLKFVNLGLVVSSGQRVLEGVTGEIKHGQLTCVLGQSGAGKTSFITTLACRAYYGRTTGDIYINGQKGNLNKFNKSVGFVRQDDIMIRQMTVEETLYFSARTRLNWSIPRSEVMKIVDNVIDVLRLNNIRHQTIGDEEKRGISGGQRKRVNVGIELVSQPLALMCDEPTSGLDSASSKELCEALQNIAHSGVNTICVIHQPRYEIFEMFEQLLLLGEGGKTVYLGPVKKVESYFENLGYVFPPKINPADYLLDITAGNAVPVNASAKQYSVPITAPNLPKIWEEYFALEQLSPEASGTEGIQSPLSNYEKPSLSLLLQFWMCLKRAVIQQLRSIPQLLVDLLLVFLGAMIISNSYKNRYYIGPPPKELSDLCPSQIRGLCEMPLDNPIGPIVLMVLLAIALVGAMSGLRTFGKELLVFKKESETGLNTFAYFLAKDIAALPGVIIGPMLFTTVFYCLQVPKAQYHTFLLTLTLVYWTSYGLGYIISLLFGSNISQLATVVIIIIHNTMNGLSPVWPEIKKMGFPLDISPYVNFLFYSQQMLYLQEIKGYKAVYDISKPMNIFGLKDKYYVRSILVVLSFGIIYRFIAYMILFSVKPNNWLYILFNYLSKLFHRTKKSIWARIAGEQTPPTLYERE